MTVINDLQRARRAYSDYLRNPGPLNSETIKKLAARVARLEGEAK